MENMETLVYANRTLPRESPLYSQVRSIKKIIYDSPLVQRIIFEKGEIVLDASGNQLNIYTRQYLPNGTFQVTRQIPKNIGGNNRVDLLNRAKRDIVQRVTDLEMKSRDQIIDFKMNDYLNKHWAENEKKLREKMGSLSPEKIDHLKKLAQSMKISEEFISLAEEAV